jgi:hypothetical protein
VVKIKKEIRRDMHEEENRPKDQPSLDDMARDSARGAPEAHYHQTVGSSSEPEAHLHQDFPHAVGDSQPAPNGPAIVQSPEELRASQDMAEKLRSGDGLAA